MLQGEGEEVETDYPPTMPGDAGGTPDLGDIEGDGSGHEGLGRQGENPPNGRKKQKRKKYGEATKDEIRFSRALGKAIGESTKRPAQPPSEYEHANHQDIHFWLTACKDLFDRNTYQWQDEADCIKYALSKLKESQVASFAMTYQKQMRGELGHTRQEGYELWDNFAEQAIRHFRPTHAEEKAQQEIFKVRYKNVIN